jgi:hypothetical protein
MTLDVDSANWTGIASLTEAERSGELTYAENTSRLRRHQIVTALITAGLLGIAVWQATLIDGISTNLFAHLFQKGPLSLALVALLFAGAAAIVWRWLTQRLDQSRQTAPLQLRTDAFVIGSSGRRIAYRDVNAIKPARSQTLLEGIAWFLYESPLRAWSRPTQLFQLELKTDSPPVLLDLDLLDGSSEKIREISDYRIRRVNS